mmetsp:Transcript_3074/g.10718  ORF Transcript_3074/g.10718 Transcript_3074/m.10718 type:complete len:280 (-) Transcript_3074:3475-4314(-)
MPSQVSASAQCARASLSCENTTALPDPFGTAIASRRSLTTADIFGDCRAQARCTCAKNRPPSMESAGYRPSRWSVGFSCEGRGSLAKSAGVAAKENLGFGTRELPTASSVALSVPAEGAASAFPFPLLVFPVIVLVLTVPSPSPRPVLPEPLSVPSPLPRLTSSSPSPSSSTSTSFGSNRINSSMKNGFRHSGHGAPPELAAAPCMGAAWNQVTMHRAHARCMHLAIVGCVAGAQQMQHCGVFPVAMSSTKPNPLCFTDAWSREVWSTPFTPAAASARM